MFKKIKELLKKAEPPVEGPTGVDYLKELFPQARLDVLGSIANSKFIFNEYGINNDARLRMFLAQMSHESAGFSALEEKRYRNTTFEDKYGVGTNVGRILGNTEPGDGQKFKGRGIIQLTGRWNYGHYGKLVGVNLLADPELATDPDVALRIALAYWRKKNLNALSDRGDVTAVTKLINGGINGLADRKNRYNKLPKSGIYARAFR